MKSKKIWANLAVDDLQTTQEFYQKLGFKLNGKSTKELVSFLFGDSDFIIHFFERDRLKSSLEGELLDSHKGNEVMFSLSAEGKEEVDNWIEVVKNAGGTIFFDPRKDKKILYDENGFYVFAFSDPDGHKFNVFFNADKK